MNRIMLYAIVTSFLLFYGVGCVGDEETEGNNGSNNLGDTGDDIREHPNADAISFDLSDVPTQNDPTATAEICDNELDDDGDTYFDCEDPDCTGDAACESTEIELDCTDTIDNDDDGRADCDDLDCAANAACTQPVGVEDCDNSIDDDHDGLTDCYDGTDCAYDAACGATSAEDCFNGIDDDDDQAVDCDDSDCTQACSGGGTGTEEDMLLCMITCLMVPDMETCLMNCMGGGMGMGETDCTNGIDDDQNGTADCQDPMCMMDPACA